MSECYIETSFPHYKGSAFCSDYNDVMVSPVLKNMVADTAIVDHPKR